MINRLMIGNYYDAINLLVNFERSNTSSNSILHLVKSKLKLLKMYKHEQKWFTKNEIVNDKSLKIFYKEHTFFFKMLDLWTFSKIDECLFYLFKIELYCKSRKEYEYVILNQLFLYIYFKTKA